MAYDTLDLALKAAAETTQDTSKTNAVHNTTVMGLIDKMFLSHTAAIWSKVEAFESGMADIDPDAPDIDPTSGKAWKDLVMVTLAVIVGATVWSAEHDCDHVGQQAIRELHTRTLDRVRRLLRWWFLDGYNGYPGPVAFHWQLALVRELLAAARLLDGDLAHIYSQSDSDHRLVGVVTDFLSSVPAK